MKKVKLNLQKLSVESFETNTVKMEKGTVKANLPDPNNVITEETCVGPNTCVHSCHFPCPF